MRFGYLRRGRLAGRGGAGTDGKQGAGRMLGTNTGEIAARGGSAAAPEERERAGVGAGSRGLSGAGRGDPGAMSVLPEAPRAAAGPGPSPRAHVRPPQRLRLARGACTV